jgi:hypothetical protein
VLASGSNLGNDSPPLQQSAGQPERPTTAQAGATMPPKKKSVKKAAPKVAAAPKKTISKKEVRVRTRTAPSVLISSLARAVPATHVTAADAAREQAKKVAPKKATPKKKPAAQPGKFGNYIALPFLVDKKDKAAAKKLGGQWFRGEFQPGLGFEGEWGVPEGIALEPFAQWMFQPGAAGGAAGTVVSEPTMLNVPFAEKNAAKKLGAKWNGEKKNWFVPAGLDPAPFAQWVPSAASMATAKKQQEKADALCEQLAAACPSNQGIIDILAELSWFELGGGNRVHQRKNKKLATEHSKLAHTIAPMTEPLNLGTATGLLASLSPTAAEDLTDLLTAGTKWICWPDEKTSDVPALRAEGLRTIADDTTPWSDEDSPGAPGEEDFTCPVGQCWRVWQYRLDHPNNYNIHHFDYYHGGHDVTGFTHKSMYKVPDTTKGYREKQINDN